MGFYDTCCLKDAHSQLKLQFVFAQAIKSITARFHPGFLVNCTSSLDEERLTHAHESNSICMSFI